MKNNIQEAIEVFRQGGIVIFPTDTAFGIGCRTDNEKAIQRLYTLRKRPETQASSLLVSTIAMAERFVENIPKDVMDGLIQQYWPGALTIVLPAASPRGEQRKKDMIPTLVRGNTETIGIRMPDHPELLEIITAVGVPILGPSANFHGEKTPFQKKDLNPELLKLVDYVVDGNCTYNHVSTVIDCVRHPWRILRDGAIKIAV